MTASAFLSANVLLAYTAYFIGTASPGPSNLAIMSLAMGSGRKAAFAFALGVMSGSFSWALLASLGLSAVLATYSQLLVAVRVVGGLYLLWLASGGASHTAPVVLGCMGIGVFVFSSYAVLFSTDTARRVYGSIRRWLDGSLAVVFSVAGVKLLTSRN
jgi:threonine efflux protein